MKKSKLKMGLITSFICGIALTACDVTANDNYVVQYKDYSGNEIGLLTDNLYSENLNTSAGLTKYYQKVRDLLVRATFEAVTDKDAVNGLKVKTPLKTLEAQAENKVEEQKETARKNAKANNTSYSDEMDAIFKSHNCEDEDGLKQHFLLELEQEQLDSAIMDNEEQLRILRDGNANEEGWIKSAKPYHIKHMLVRIEGGADNYTRATITETEATKLSKVVTLLAKGESFDDLASNNLLTDDSSDSLGDVGIVNNNATTKSLKMVSEFQLGIYTADVKVNNMTAETAQGIGLDAKVSVDGENEKTVEELLNVVEVPYGAFKDIGDVAKYPEDTEDAKIKDINACVYPRNVLWNKYFNNHNVFVITNKTKDVNANGNESLVTDTIDPDTQNAEKVDVTRFNDKGYLTAEDGRVIFGVRSEYGIHFIKIQKSPYEENLDAYYPIALKVGDTDVTTQPLGSNYIVGLDNSKKTFDTRLADIKSAIKSYDSNSEYRLYNYLVSFAKANHIIETNEESDKLLARIDEHINDLKAAEVYKQKEGLKSVWENYLRMIELQNTKRGESWTDGYFYTKYVEGSLTTFYTENDRTALVPETTGDKYLELCQETNNTEKAKKLVEFVEGGTYYYGK